MRTKQERLLLILFFTGILAIVIIMGGLLISPLLNLPSPPIAAASPGQEIVSPAATAAPLGSPISTETQSSSTSTPPLVESTTIVGFTGTPAISPQPQLTAVAIGQPTQPASTAPTESGFTRPTRSAPASTGSPAPNATPTFDDNPSLLMTPFAPPPDTPTPPPLTDLGNSVELAVAQVQRIAVAGGYVLAADVSNTTGSGIKDVRLVFTDSSGARVGEAKSLNVNLPPNDARPGATALLSASDPIIVNWGALQARAIGTPVTAQAGQAGYVVALEVSYPQISQGASGYDYQVTVTNNTGGRVSILNQSLAFFAIDGTLLSVVDLGAHAPLNNGETYELTGTIPITQPAAEGRTLAEYTDVLGNVVGEVGP